MPYVSEIMDEELIEILSPYDFHSEVENIEKAQELVNKIHAHKSNEAVEILKDIENQGCKNLEDVLVYHTGRTLLSMTIKTIFFSILSNT